MNPNLIQKEFPIPKISQEQLREFLERLPYLSENIKNITYERDKEKIYVTLKMDADREVEIIEEYNNLLKSVTSWRMIKERTMKSNLPLHSKLNNVQIRQEKRFFNELDLKLMDFFDQSFVKIAKKYSAVLRDYPTTLSYENMNKNQYHHNFPQNIYSVYEVPHNNEILQLIRKDRDWIHQYFKSSNQFLQPCVCYHCYEEWENSKILNQVLTAKGKCFRHEIPWKTNKFRKQEFTMREIVFLGNQSNVLKLRDDILEDVWSFFHKLDLLGKIVTANDPFYYKEDFRKASFQKIYDSKYELKAVFGEDEVVMASFNYCDKVLCEKYNIRDLDNNFYFSGCVAFGLDRWVEVFIERYGEDEEKWPFKLKN